MYKKSLPLQRANVKINLKGKANEENIKGNKKSNSEKFIRISYCFFTMVLTAGYFKNTKQSK